MDLEKQISFQSLSLEIRNEIFNYMSLEKDLFLQIGDNIYCSTYGIGEIIDIKLKNLEKPIDGSNIQILIKYKYEDGDRQCQESLFDFCYYGRHKLESSIEDFKKDTQDLSSGTITMPELLQREFGVKEIPNTQELVITNKNLVEEKRVELIKQRNFITARYKYLEVLLDHRKRALYKYIDEVKGHLEKANKLIRQLEIYLGIEETLEQIQVGIDAPEDSSICFRQRIMYMDVECGDPMDQGIDFSSLDKFDAWLLNTNAYWKKKNYEILIPEDKCIAVFRIRKDEKRYYDNPFINSLINTNNNVTYIFIRNGENIYKICSEKINISKRLFPTKNELESIFKGMQSNYEYDQKQSENKIFGYKLHIIFLQGILERSGIFLGGEDIKLFDPLVHETGKIKFIYDDDQSMQLPTDILPFKEWQRKLNSQIEEGNRIFFFKRGFNNTKDEMRYRIFRQYIHNDYAIPGAPEKDIYSVYKDNKTLYIKYIYKNPWSCNEGRGKGYSFMIDKDSDDFFINYDVINEKELETLEFYMYTRIGREAYLSYIPILMELYKSRKIELDYEKEFIKLVLSQNKLENTPENNKLVLSCIDWWKLKNKWKRGLEIDNTKALRMIGKKLKNKDFDNE